MDKENFDHFQDDAKANGKKGNQQILEISSTGYGLESSSENSEKPQSSGNPSCGGL